MLTMLRKLNYCAGIYAQNIIFTQIMGRYIVPNFSSQAFVNN